MINGNCNCGAVRYEIDSDTSDVYICHCSICRRFTGSSGIAVLVVEKSRFKWLSGEEHVSTWKKPNSQWECWFCRNCGSALPGANTETTVFVPAGSITGGAGELHVAHHIFVGSKASWDVIGDNGKQHLEAYS